MSDPTSLPTEPKTFRSIEAAKATARSAFVGDERTRVLEQLDALAALYTICGDRLRRDFPNREEAQAQHDAATLVLARMGAEIPGVNAVYQARKYQSAAARWLGREDSSRPTATPSALPALQGAPSECVLAQGVRQRTLDELERRCDQLRAQALPNGQPDTGAQDFARKLQSVAPDVRQITDAKLWIAHRGDDNPRCAMAWALVQRALRQRWPL